MWWLYVLLVFDDFVVVLIIQEEFDGFCLFNDCIWIWCDGYVEQLGWLWVWIYYCFGICILIGVMIEVSIFDGVLVYFDVEFKLVVLIYVGGGYGGDLDWLYGMWKGEKFVE